MYLDDIFILGPLAIDVTIDVGLELKSHLMPTGLTICNRKFVLLFHRLEEVPSCPFPVPSTITTVLGIPLGDTNPLMRQLLNQVTYSSMLGLGRLR